MSVLLLIIALLLRTCVAVPSSQINESAEEESRKVLGSRVVTSVSVIMDSINNTKTYFSDAVGKPVARPATSTQLASPINLLNPDKYEFYTFDDNGDLVKRLMTLDEIQGIIASGDGEPSNYYTQLSGDFPEQRVDEVINNVQNVLKEEIQAHNPSVSVPEINGPNISSTWNLILPAVFGTNQNGTNVTDTITTTTLNLDTVSVDKESTVSPSERENVKIATSSKIDTESLSLNDLPFTNSNNSLNEVNKNTELLGIENSTIRADIETLSTVEQESIDSHSNIQSFLKTTIDGITDITETTTFPNKIVTDSKQTSKSENEKTTTYAADAFETSSQKISDTQFMTVQLSTLKWNPSEKEDEMVFSTSLPTTTIKSILKQNDTINEALFNTKSPIDNKDEISKTTDINVIQDSSVLKQVLTSQETNTEWITLSATSEYFTQSTLPAEVITIEQKKIIEQLQTTMLPIVTKDVSLNELNEDTITTQNIQPNLLSTVGTTTISDVPILESTTLQDVDAVSENLLNVVTEGAKTTTEDLNLKENISTSQTETTTYISVETTTDINRSQTSLDFDENINDSVDSVISQIINKDISQTTIENLPITSYGVAETDSFGSTTGSLIDISDKNRYEEIDLDAEQVTSTMRYEGKTIQSDKFAPNNDISTFGSITISNQDSTTDNIHYSTYSVPINSTIPIKNLKTDSDDIENKFSNTKESTIILTTEDTFTNDTKQNMSSYITEPSLLSNITFKSTLSTQDSVSTTNSIPTKLSTTNEPVTEQAFVTVETVTSPSRSENQHHFVNRISSTTPKHETTWTLVSTVESNKPSALNIDSDKLPGSTVDLVPKPLEGFSLEDSTSGLDTDVFQFIELCNELAFGFWNSVTSGISFARSVVVSPFATTSILAMVFLGARGATSGEMNDILKLDDMVTFNPHAVFKSVIESIEVSKNSGIASSVFVKELYSDKSKGKLLQFYKERVKQFYDGYVEEVSFKEINDIIRRRTNLLVKRQTWGKISEYLKDNSLLVRPPLAAIAANIFQTDCTNASTIGRDGEIHFVVLPSIRQRKLVPIPAVVYRSGFLAGYEPGLDATAVAIGNKDNLVSTIFVIPGQQGISAPGDGLIRLETRLIESAFKQNAWSRLLRSLIPRPGLEVQIPRFSHKSVINATAALQRMGLKDVFNSHTADLKGLNGIAHELYLSDIVQINTFATCGEGRIDETHHSEIYPATTNRSFRKIRKILNYHYQASPHGDVSDEPHDYQRAFHDPLYDPTYLSLPLQFRPRQARLPDTPRLRFDRPFLYFVRHNPTGLILHMGRFNPRLLP